MKRWKGGLQPILRPHGGLMVVNADRTPRTVELREIFHLEVANCFLTEAD